MVENNLIINHKKIMYHGVFRTDELFSVLNRALQDKEYTRREKKSEELVTPSGRLLQLELRPFKIVSQYLTMMIKIHVTLDNVTETTKEIFGVTQKFQQGDLLIVFDAWSLSDYEGRWGTKPLTYFLKGVVHKYLYKFPMEEGFTHQLVSDTAYLYGKIKDLLQSYEGKKIPSMREDEILKRVEEEMLRKSESEI